MEPPLYKRLLRAKMAKSTISIIRGGTTMNVNVLGIDLAKNVFQLHGIDATGKPVLRKKLTRAKLAVFITQLPHCLIGMEACSSSHYWARKFQ